MATKGEHNSMYNDIIQPLSLPQPYKKSNYQMLFGHFLSFILSISGLIAF